jgi:hypothetical protein
MTSDGCKPAKGRREPCSPSERCTCQCRLDAKEFRICAAMCCNPCLTHQLDQVGSDPYNEFKLSITLQML